MSITVTELSITIISTITYTFHTIRVLDNQITYSTKKPFFGTAGKSQKKGREAVLVTDPPF